LAVASGKGGTGKTTVAVNLALAAAGRGLDVAYLDCDVEEPNGHIFLKPEIETERPIGTPIPVVDRDACVGCGECGRICRFSAIVQVAAEVLVFPELCHGCGGCSLVCPTGAVREVSRERGRLRLGAAGPIRFADGLLNVGEVAVPSLIKAVKTAVPPADLTVIDAPPGTSCPVIESLRGSDFVLLVTEPTPFGLHDLKLAAETVRVMGLPFGVLINRAGFADAETRGYCRDNGIGILGEIPDDRRVAEAYSRGETAIGSLPEYRGVFAALLDAVAAAAGPLAPGGEGA